MKKYLTKELLLILAISTIPVLLVYLPFILKLHHLLFIDLKESGILQIVRNWDGPQFLIVAKSFYNRDIIQKLLFNTVDITYYAAHFPLYPVLIRIVTPIFGWFYSGLVINLLFGFLCNLLFFHLAKKYTSAPLFLTFVFTVFPARFLVIRSIISPETMMLFFILLSLWLWDQKKYISSSLVGAVAVLTKFQSVFLIPAYIGTVIEDYLKTKKLPSIRILAIIAMPLSFALLSFIYLIQFNDFNAFFNAEKNNNLGIHLPFSQFNYSNSWIGVTPWLEDIIFYFIAMLVLTITLYKRKERVWFYFTLFYTLFLIFLPHRDIARYSFQLAPIFFLTFQEFFTSKTFKYAAILSLPAIYFYVINFIMTNQAPVADWNHFIQ